MDRHERAGELMRAEINGFDEVDKLLEKIANGMLDATLEAVDTASPYLVETSSKAVRRKSGELAKSFKATKARNNKYGSYSVIKPEGYDSNGTSNYAKAVFLEYGTTHSQAYPWRQKAVNDARSKVEASLQKTLEDAINRQGGG